MNNYLKGKLLFKLNKNELFKKKTETTKINFGKAYLFSFAPAVSKKAPILQA